MKVIIITRNEPRHMYFANQICRRFAVAQIFVETPAGYWQKVLKTKSVSYILNYWYKQQKNTLLRVKRKEAEYFFGKDISPAFERQDLVQAVANINAVGLAQNIKGLKPDVVLTFGCSVLAKEFLNTASQGIINIHSGIVPEYRGVDCVFWSMYNNQFSMVGSTIHFVNERIEVINQRLVPKAGIAKL